jgi:hypothetical protein
MSHVPPAIIAMADQIIADADHRLQHVIDNFREHTAQHGGDILCPFATVNMTALLDPSGTAEVFAAAVARLARET